MIKPDKDFISRIVSGDAFVDWNKIGYQEYKSVPLPDINQLKNLVYRSECLRDGLGSANKNPSYDEMVAYIKVLSDLGIDMVTVGILSSSDIVNLNKQDMQIGELVGWMKNSCTCVRPVVLARALPYDVEQLVRLNQLNPNLIAIIFQDISEVRRFVQGWGTASNVINKLGQCIRSAVSQGVDVMAFTENLSITSREDIEHYVEVACGSGAKWIGVADTAGRLLPVGAYAITDYVRRVIGDVTSKQVEVVFHGHNDRGFAISNAYAAVSAGARVIDVVTNGEGERVGNTDLIQFGAGVNEMLRALGQDSRFSEKKLIELSSLYSSITDTKPYSQPPILGPNSYSTSFGIHADYYYRVEQVAEAMIIEGIYDHETVTKFKQEAWRVYSADSPAKWGREPKIRINKYSGSSNVIMRLKKLGIIKSVNELEKTDERVIELLNISKGYLHDLDDEILLKVWNNLNRSL